jgi:5-methylcytosine-specific restriction protein B
MDFEVIKRFHIESALKRIDDGEKIAGIAESNTYDLVFEGKPYAPKLVVAIAYKLATGKNITGKDFDGGEGTACFSILRKNGFVVLPKIDLNVVNSTVEKIKKFALSYVNAKKSKNTFSTQHDLLKNIGTKLKNICDSRGFGKIIIKTSIGQGSFAEVPWICFFHPDITDKASSGHYPVLLFSADMKSLFFSYCISNGEIEKLGDTSDKLRTNLVKSVSHLSNLGFGDTLKLGGTTSTPKGYENGAIISKKYTIESLNPEVLLVDLTNILATYENIAQGVNSPPKISKEMNTENILKSAIAAKQFTIIAGGTGTGKTRSARQLAIQIAGEDNVATVAVGSDWTDNRPLLGFRNLLSNDGKSYVVPAALKLILKADKNLRGAESASEMTILPKSPNDYIEPHFLILDEMNLSHVERYFADFLSSMESHEPLRLHDCIEGLKSDGTNEIVPHQVAWPKNLFIIGTVNIDETTYMFSPKVLDRAHVIEFKVPWNEIEVGLSSPPARSLPRWEPSMTNAFMNIALDKDKSLENQNQEKLLSVLEDLYECLEGTRFNFAHRTARECLNYIATSLELSKEKLTLDTDLISLIDLAILQKALPKINGSTGSLSKVLDALVQFSAKHKLTNCETKLKKMSEQLKNDQFVSFIQ